MRAGTRGAGGVSCRAGPHWGRVPAAGAGAGAGAALPPRAGGGFGSVTGVVAKRGTSSRRTTSRSGARTRRTGSSASRRRTPKTSTTLGSAFALGLIALFTRASWPVRTAVVVVALVAVAGYLVVRARRGTAPEPEPPAAAAAVDQKDA